MERELNNFLRFISKNNLFGQEIYLGARPTRHKNVCPESALYNLPVSLIEKIKSKKRGLCLNKYEIHYLSDKPYYLDYVLVRKK
ncbi:hypothetical protein M0R19_00310 [Candidatus Pacearchaeota archaeon]|nr:hypothetical protein [Candidatus Pacearchaeota archaeon]